MPDPAFASPPAGFPDIVHLPDPDRPLENQHRGYVCDVTQWDACQRVAEQVIQDFGAIDVLINNAGITPSIRLLDIKPENYDAVLDVNLRGMPYLSQAFIPHLIRRSQGSIACTSPVSGQAGDVVFGGPHYSAAKAGMLGLTKDMAKDRAGDAGSRRHASSAACGDREAPAGLLDHLDRLRCVLCSPTRETIQQARALPQCPKQQKEKACTQQIIRMLSGLAFGGTQCFPNPKGSDLPPRTESKASRKATE